MEIKGNVLVSVYSRDIKNGTFIIPKNVTTIGKYAINSYLVLKKIELPNSIKIIGDGAFEHCHNLKEVIIHEGVTTIDNFVFYDCDSLRKVNIPQSVTTIDNYVFRNCTSLKELTLPKKLITIGKGLFQDCVNLEKVIIPEGVKVIKDFAFSNCTSLKKVTIPQSVTNIGYKAFENCSNLNLTLESSLVNLKEYNFENIKSLTIYNYKFEDIELAMDKLNEIREEELQDKINFALLDNYIFDDKCFKYIEHKKFINKIINNIETKENYDYRMDFNNYINDYVNEHKPKELVEIKNIQSMLIDINNYKVDDINLKTSSSIEKYGNELVNYSLIITSLLSNLQTNSKSTININKILDKITKLKSKDTDNLSKIIEKTFFDVTEDGLVLNKSFINKIISHTRYKVCSLNDEINGFEILKEIINKTLEKIKECKEKINDVEIIDIEDERLLNIDKNSIQSKKNIKIIEFNNSEIVLTSLYNQINNLSTINKIKILKLKEIIMTIIPGLLNNIKYNKIVLKNKEEIEMLNSICDTLKELIEENNREAIDKENGKKYIK